MFHQLALKKDIKVVLKLISGTMIERFGKNFLSKCFSLLKEANKDQVDDQIVALPAVLWPISSIGQSD